MKDRKILEGDLLNRADNLEKLIIEQRQQIDAAIAQLHFLEGGLRMVKELLASLDEPDKKPAEAPKDALTLEELGKALGADSIEVVGGTDGQAKKDS